MPWQLAPTRKSSGRKCHRSPSSLRINTPHPALLPPPASFSDILLENRNILWFTGCDPALLTSNWLILVFFLVNLYAERQPNTAHRTVSSHWGVCCDHICKVVYEKMRLRNQDETYTYLNIRYLAKATAFTNMTNNARTILKSLKNSNLNANFSVSFRNIAFIARAKCSLHPSSITISTLMWISENSCPIQVIQLSMANCL